MQPRALPVLVLGWGELEVDVLSESDGLSSPAEAIRRAGQENHTDSTESPPLRDVAFGPGDEVLVLCEVGDTTVLDQRTLD